MHYSFRKQDIKPANFVKFFGRIFYPQKHCKFFEGLGCFYTIYSILIFIDIHSHKNKFNISLHACKRMENNFLLFYVV